MARVEMYTCDACGVIAHSEQDSDEPPVGWFTLRGPTCAWNEEEEHVPRSKLRRVQPTRDVCGDCLGPLLAKSDARRFTAVGTR